MNSYSIANIATILSLLGLGAAHMVMNTPIPYDKHKVSTSPLDKAKFNFPCQSGYLDFSKKETTSIVAGESQNVSFTGQAVHGGGSCQFAVNYDFPPSSDPARWKTIYTIIGGCPSDTAGNLEDGPWKSEKDEDQRPTAPQCGNASGKDCLRSYNIPIPKQLPTGNASFAWTWFNKIGNREMYMNCAPISITEGAADNTFLDSLPPIFFANVAGVSNCTTGEGVINIPNPGTAGALLQAFNDTGAGDCVKAPTPNFPTTMAEGSTAATGAGSGAANATATGGGGCIPSGDFVTKPGAQPCPTGAAGTSTKAPYPTSKGNSTGAFVPKSLKSSAAAGTSTSAPASTNTPTTMQTMVSSSGSLSYPSGAPKPTGPVEDKVPCSREGALVCGSTELWGLCDRGFALMRKVAAGTMCENGLVVAKPT